MKNIKTNSLAILTVFTLSVSATDYDDAKFQNYISGQGVNEVLTEAQEIICIVGKLGTEQLAGDGSYKAILFADLCEQAAPTASTAGQTAPTSANSTSSSSSSTDGGAAETAKEIDTLVVNSGFLTSTLQQTKVWKVNDKPWDDETNRSPKAITYILSDQTSPVSSTSRFGEFTLRYQASTFGNKQSDLPEWYDCPDETSRNYAYSWCADGADLGRGLLIADTSQIKFKSDIQSSQQQNLVANYSDNGDIAGIYTRTTGFQDDSLRDPNCDGSDDWWECQSQAYRDSSVNILGIFAFGISDEDKTYCTTMSELYEVDWENYNEETQGPTLKPYTLTGEPLKRLGSEGWDVAEKCYSINKSDAIQNVHQYGVYNSDGSEFKQANPSFPIRTNVTVNEVDRRVHGYASYWGVHVDDVYQQYVTDETQWLKDDGSDDSDTPATFKVIPRKLVVEKREKTFLALNEIDGLNLNFWTNDSWWSDEFQKLGFAKVEPWNGKIQFKSNKAVFTDYNNGVSSEPLNYGLYGSHDGNSTYIANLVGAKIDRDNLRKIIKNDASDPGKAMNLTMEFAELPNWGYEPNEWVSVLLCTGSSLTSTIARPYDLRNHFTYLDGQMCIKLDGDLKMSSDGSEMVLSTTTRDNVYGAEFYDSSTGTTINFDRSNWNQGGNVYDFKIGLSGIERPAFMELKLQSLFTAFGSLSQFDNNGGTLSGGLEAFLDSSDSFTYMVVSNMNLYDFEGNRFNKIKGSFNVSDTPVATINVDDAKVAESSTSVSSSFAFTLSSAQASAVSFDYVISASSTVSTSDYSNLVNGTVTIAAGATSGTIPFSIEPDALVEGQTDEKLILSLSNPTNAVLARTDVVAYIYDDDTNRVVYDDYAGTFSAETGTFTITDGLIYNPSYEKTTLPAPITFTLTEWLTNMQKTYGVGEDWEFTEYRDLGVYSQDTNSQYQITKSSFENPTSNTLENGISTIQNSIVPLSELPATLNCIQECLVSSLITDHYTDVKNQADPAGDGTYTSTVSSASPNPYADVGPYVKTTFTETTTYNAGTENEYTDTRDWTRGEHRDGILASDVYVYSVDTSVLKDASSDDLSIGVDWQLSRPYDKIRGAKFTSVEGGWTRETQWGVNTGSLVDDATLAKLECNYTTDDEGVKSYTDTHPEYTAANGKIALMRYCTQKLWSSNDVMVTYNVRLETYKQYEIFNSDGSNVTFDPQKLLYFTAPDDATKFGSDAGKKLRLDYQGDHLGGIPGSVINLETGEDLGEYVETWSDNYRWVPRFTIPDGSVLTENTSDNTYITKALRGEEWLGKKDSAIGSLETLLTSVSKDQLLTNVDLDFEISVRKDIRYDCSIKIERTDDNGNTYTDTDYEACDASDDPSVWVLTNSFDSCREMVTYETNRLQDQINQQIQEQGENYPADGPRTVAELIAMWEAENPGSAKWYTDMVERCKTIGPIPSSTINGGEPSVVNGDIVFDPTS